MAKCFTCNKKCNLVEKTKNFCPKCKNYFCHNHAFYKIIGNTGHNCVFEKPKNTINLPKINNKLLPLSRSYDGALA